MWCGTGKLSGPQGSFGNLFFPQVSIFSLHLLYSLLLLTAFSIVSFPVSSKLHFAQGPARWGAGTILWHHFLIGLHYMVALYPRISKFRLFEPLCLIQLFTTTPDCYIRNKIMYRICMLIIVKHQWKISKKIWIESSVHVLLCLKTLQAKMSGLPKLDLHI